MVGPRFIDLAERLRHRNEWQTPQQRINGLPMEVQLTGRPMALQALPLTLPAGWQLKNGATGTLSAQWRLPRRALQLLQGDEVKRRIALTPPLLPRGGPGTVKQQGFSLLEAIVALTILAGASMALFGWIGASINQLQTSRTVHQDCSGSG